MSDQSGLFFREISQAKVSYDSFVLVYHVNISSYYAIKENTALIHDSIRRLCKSQDDYCDMILLDMEKKINRITDFERNIEIYEPTKSRPRRHPVIAATALLTSVAFGTIEWFKMSKYEKMINELKADYNILHKIDTDETIFFKENIIANKNAYIHLVNITNEMTTEFEQKLESGYRGMTWANREIVIIRLRDLFEIWIGEHQHLSEIIVDHLENIKHGKMTHLIPVDFFQKDLMTIENMLPSNQKLPIDIRRENPLSIFNFITTKTSIHAKKLYIEMTIPRVDKDNYNLFKIIPIPIFINNYIMIIIPSMEYVLIDEGQKSFTPLSSKEVDDNLLQYNWGGIISPNDNIYHDFHDNCEMSLFIHPKEADIKELCNVRTLPITNYFISLGTLNQYFMVVTKPTTLIETCNSTITKRLTIRSSGKLTLSEGCQVRTHKITLRSRIKTKIEENVELGVFTNINNITFEHMLENITKISKPQQLHFKKHSILIDDHIEEFNALADHADGLIEQLAYNNRFDEIYRDKVRDNLFVSTGLVIFIGMLLMIFAYVLYKKFNNIKTWTNLAGRLGMNRGIQNQTVGFSSPDTIYMT